MVAMGLFGPGEGKMEIALKSQNVAPGQALEGTATLTLNKDVKGKEVVAILYAERTMTQMGMGGGGSGMSQSKMNVYTNKQSLDGEKLYAKSGSPYQYKFSFVIPQANAAGSQPNKNAQAAEMFLGSMAGLMGGSNIVRWYIKVELKHEGLLSFPIEKTQEVNIVYVAP